MPQSDVASKVWFAAHVYTPQSSRSRSLHCQVISQFQVKLTVGRRRAPTMTLKHRTQQNESQTMSQPLP